MAIENAKELISDFSEALSSMGLACSVVHEHQAAPHKGQRLREGFCAVYVFSLSRQYGSRTKAGANRVLKVGKAGANCNPRFQSQHYSTKSAPSTLAATLVKTKVLWPFIGVTSVDDSTVRKWIEENTDRDNFLVQASDGHLLGKLETFLKGRLGPVFEGGTE